MFNPTRDQVRQFFCEVRRKAREGLPLAGAELTAIDIVLAHPEYHALLDDPERALGRDWTPEDGQTNPFLHMAMHLAIEEQRSINQPPGIAAALADLESRTGDRHAAGHVAMECLGEMMWTAQRSGATPDAERYLECLRRGR
jgi:Domain of unknown function (DUF1841)